jgi:hypothetical protein
MSRVTTAFLTAFLMAAPLAAQRQPPVQEGARVRFTVLESRAFWIGNVLPSAPDSFAVEYPSGDVFTVPLGQLESLKMSGGTRTRRLEGALLGTLLGVGWGLLIEKDKPTTRYDNCRSAGEGPFGWLPICDVTHQDRQYAKAGGLGGFAGAVIGAVVGSAFKTERWVSIPLEFRLP